MAMSTPPNAKLPLACATGEFFWWATVSGFEGSQGPRQQDVHSSVHILGITLAEGVGQMPSRVEGGRFGLAIN